MGPAWTGAVNVAFIGIRTPERPARSESLNRLSYHSPYTSCIHNIIFRWNILYCHDEAGGFFDRVTRTYVRRSCTMTLQC